MPADAGKPSNACKSDLAGASVKAAAFRYVRAQSLEHCLAVLAEYGDEARILAGGQSLLPSLALRLSAPAVLVDVNRVAALSGEPQVSEDWVRLPALLRHAQLITSPLVQAHLSLLHWAAPWIAHPGIRNQGTVCGSLAVGDPASELPACAVASGARLVLQSQARGTRVVPAREFYVGLMQTACAPDEMIVAVEFPRMDGLRTGFREVARRRGDYAMVGLAGVARRGGRGLTQTGLTFFGIGDRPLLAASIGAAIEKADTAAQAVALALEAYARDITPNADLWCSGPAKKHIGRSVLEEVVHDLFQ
jgi:carbon-monoxide dehydrogenase medium subunit